MIILSDQNSSNIFIFNIEFCTTWGTHSAVLQTKPTFRFFWVLVISQLVRKLIKKIKIYLWSRFNLVQFEYPQSRKTVVFRFYQWFFSFSAKKQLLLSDSRPHLEYFVKRFLISSDVPKSRVLSQNQKHPFQEHVIFIHNDLTRWFWD